MAPREFLVTDDPATAAVFHEPGKRLRKLQVIILDAHVENHLSEGGTAAMAYLRKKCEYLTE
jgi:hypothetical protein